MRAISKMFLTMNSRLLLWLGGGVGWSWYWLHTLPEARCSLLVVQLFAPTNIFNARHLDIHAPSPRTLSSFPQSPSSCLRKSGKPAPPSQSPSPHSSYSAPVITMVAQLRAHGSVSW